MEISLKEWLWLPCLPEEVLGDEPTGYYLGILKVKEKIKFMEDNFKVTVHYSNFHHFLFNRMDKEVFSSGSIEIEISEVQTGSVFTPFYSKRLVGAYSFNISDYDNPQDRNEQYAGTTKSLCIMNALGSEYPQFGSLLNRKELVRTVQGKKNFKTSSAITGFQKTL